MEEFKIQKRKGLWSEHGEYAADAVEDSPEGTRADELLDGQNWNIASEPTVVKPTLDYTRKDPMEPSFIQKSVAETLLGEIDLSLAPAKMTFDNGRSYDQRPVDPREPTPVQKIAAETILTNETPDNSVLVATKRLTEIQTEEPVRQASYDTTPRAPFPNNNTYDSIGKNSLNPTTPRAGASEKTKSFFRKLFGG